MGQEGKHSGDGSKSPFGNGKGATKSAGANSGAHDFVTDPKSGAPNGDGGRDFTKESRPQSEAQKEVAPNPQEIPAGGPWPVFTPGPASEASSSTNGGTQPAKPYKLGK